MIWPCLLWTLKYKIRNSSTPFESSSNETLGCQNACCIVLTAWDSDRPPLVCFNTLTHTLNQRGKYFSKCCVLPYFTFLQFSLYCSVICFSLLVATILLIWHLNLQPPTTLGSLRLRNKSKDFTLTSPWCLSVQLNLHHPAQLWLYKTFSQTDMLSRQSIGGVGYFDLNTAWLTHQQLVVSCQKLSDTFVSWPSSP